MAELSLGVYYHPHESSPCSNSYIINSSVSSVGRVIARVSNLHLRILTKGRALPPADSKIHDTLSTGIRPGYNKVFT